ncbi:MAG: hypothetical protein IPF41_04580 [Flavobacteriales bacterium]|nr:hypothetical protein [Flavobacteriales bacterium]
MLLQATADSVPNAGVWVLGVLAAAAAAVFMAVKKKGEAVDRASIIYLFVPVPLFALAGWLAHRWWGAGLDAWDYLAIQVLALLVGIAHARLLYHEVFGLRVLTWPERSSAWSWKQFGFTFMLMLSAIAGILLLGVIDVSLQPAWSYWLATITMLVPFLTVKAYDMYMGIPAAVYTPWYPLLDELFTYEPHPQFPKVKVQIDLGDGRSGETENVPFDPNVRLERVYRWILHNYLRSEQELYYTERDGVNYVWGWHFHRQRRGLLRWQRRLDPKDTVRKCRLKHGDTLVAVRVESLVPLDAVREQMLRRGEEVKKKT